MKTKQKAINTMFSMPVSNGMGVVFQYPSGKWGYATYGSDLEKEIREQRATMFIPTIPGMTAHQRKTCYTKTRYRNRREARKALKLMLANGDPTAKKRVAYACDYCGGAHCR